MPSQTTATNPPHPLDTFPPPQTFTILPQIHTLLLRLEQSSPSSETPNPTTLDPSTQAQPLSLKDLPSAAAPIRLKIAKAKAAVDAMPDVERTVREQEVEMKALEQKIWRFRGVLARLDKAEGLP